MSILDDYRNHRIRPTMLDKLATVETDAELRGFERGLERQGLLDGNAKIAIQQQRNRIGEKR